jgi:hypothetical protein
VEISNFALLAGYTYRRGDNYSGITPEEDYARAGYSAINSPALELY